jgi:hypothetical protein
MKKYLLPLIIILIVAVYYLYSYVPFQPKLLRTGQNSGYYSISVDDNFQVSLGFILKKYDVDYKLKNGKIYIRRRLSFDDELVWNYTEKALAISKDSLTLKNQHIVPQPSDN